jgi:SPP1 gp7 family putative phage head morphogenesis protein
MECQREGQPGWKFGEQGFCFIGPEARKKAAAQGAAIKISQQRKDASIKSNKELIRSRRTMIKATGGRLPSITRQPTRQAEGRTLEVSYFRKLNNFLQPYFSDVRERLIPQLSEIVEQFKNEVRVDNSRFDQTYGEVITKAINDINLGVAINMTDTGRRVLAANQAGLISNFDKTQFTRQIQTVLGVNPLLDEPWLDPQINSFVERNAALIKDIPEQSISRIETKIRIGVERGDSLAKLTSEIQDELKIAKNRAKLIARDQTNKFIGKLTELRQSSLGVTEYVWSTSRDERVRPAHRARDGKVFKWSDPPSDGHPGEPIQCRCRAIPVLDNLKPAPGVKTKSPTGKSLIGTAIAAETIRRLLTNGG